MAHALDLECTAKQMVALNLVTCGSEIHPAQVLRQFSEIADRQTLVAIAQILLNHAPPPWLRAAIDNHRVVREYIPSEDLDALAWLGEDLDTVLLRAHHNLLVLDLGSFRSRFGAAAELIVLAAKRRAGVDPIHVAMVSDSYGYDIECRCQPVERIEVKAATVRTKHSFYISRNEYEKSKVFRNEWQLIQVVFSNAAFVSNQLDVGHVEEVRRLRDCALERLVPADTPEFRWSESAEISPPADAWETADIALDPDFNLVE